MRGGLGAVLIAAVWVVAGCAEPAAEAPVAPASLGAALRAVHGPRADAVLSPASVVFEREDRLVLSRQPLAPGAAPVRATPAPAPAELVAHTDRVSPLELRVQHRDALSIREEGALGAVERVEGTLGFARVGGRSYWTVSSEGPGFEEWLALDPGVAVGDRVLARWRVEGHALREVRETGGVHVLDGRGEPIVYVSAERAWAAGGEEVRPRLAVEDGAIVLRADAGGRAVLVDPSWTPTGMMAIARAEFYGGFGMVAVPGGALVVGGNVSAPGPVAERYSIATRTWSSAGVLPDAYLSGVITLVLPGGRVLAFCAGAAHLYDPATGTWSATGAPGTGFSGPYASATSLADGRVLAVASSSSRIYDPASETWSSTAPLHEPRTWHNVVRLLDGRVLVAGGMDPSTGSRTLHAELFDPLLETWSVGAFPVVLAEGRTATRLSDGRVLFTGGGYYERRAEVFDPGTATFAAVPPMQQGRYYHVALVTPLGRVVVSGGGTTSGAASLYAPSLDRWLAGGTSLPWRERSAAALLENGQILVAGGYAASVETADSELFVDSYECGNGALEPGEQCDDGNTSDGDCCASSCVIEPASTVCRPSYDACDLAEQCDGTTGLCPPDMVTTPGTACRPSVGACDLEETCDGASPSCPPDALAPALTVCRASRGACDSIEYCDGVSVACPGDSVLALGTPCRPAAGPCDVPEACAGLAACPLDRSQPDGASCGDGLACTGAEVCASGLCPDAPDPSCDDGNACTADACAEPGGCASSPIAGCCNLALDCADDGDVCTVERCSGPGGTCSSAPVTGCCRSDLDCTGGGACVTMRCDPGTSRCSSTPVAGCCTSASDCADGDACTTDACDAATHSCSSAPIAGCCVGDGDCSDRNDCTADRCDRSTGGPTGTCRSSAIAGCCRADADCADADGDPCTVPGCDAATGRCREAPRTCDDGDACTVDACSAADGSCLHAPLACDDGDACTRDACRADGTCGSTPIAGCGPDAGAGDAGASDAGALDAAALPDAGVLGDASASPDASEPIDAAGRDAAARDASGSFDAGPDAAGALVTSRGCGCRAGSPRSRGSVALLLVSLLLVGHRRRARSRRWPRDPDPAVLPSA